jgi:succinate dehydrogenase / fumarate reductase membrane anchor subunit
MTAQRTIYESGRDPSTMIQAKPRNPGFERFMWWFMRISGVILVFLALGHMIIMHIVTELTGQEVNFAFVTDRWGTPFWRIYDFLLLLLALIHGVNGARIVIGDYLHRGGWRTVAFVALAAVTAVWMVLGMVIIIAFNPNTAPSGLGPFSMLPLPGTTGLF